MILFATAALELEIRLAGPVQLELSQLKTPIPAWLSVKTLLVPTTQIVSLSLVRLVILCVPLVMMAQKRGVLLVLQMPFK